MMPILDRACIVGDGRGGLPSLHLGAPSRGPHPYPDPMTPVETVLAGIECPNCNAQVSSLTSGCCGHCGNLLPELDALLASTN
jgi:hypothetical protein